MNGDAIFNIIKKKWKNLNSTHGKNLYLLKFILLRWTIFIILHVLLLMLISFVVDFDTFIDIEILSI